MKFVLCLKLAQSLGKYRMNERMSDRAESVRLDTFTDCDEREREREKNRSGKRAHLVLLIDD